MHDNALASRRPGGLPMSPSVRRPPTKPTTTIVAERVLSSNTHNTHGIASTAPHQSFLAHTRTSSGEAYSECATPPSSLCASTSAMKQCSTVEMATSNTCVNTAPTT